MRTLWLRTVVACIFCILSPLATGQTNRQNAALPADPQRTFSRSEDALAEAKRANERIHEHTDCLAQAEQRNRKLDDQHWKLTLDLRKLIAERDKTLLELLSGMFCSKCERSASEIERATHRSFGEHLTEVNGVPLPAPRELFERKKKEYNDKIKALRGEIAMLEKEHKAIMLEADRCDHNLRVASMDYYVAMAWTNFLTDFEHWGRTGQSPAKLTPPTQLTAALFGLAGNRKVSDYYALRAKYPNGGGVLDNKQTLFEVGPIQRPDLIQKQDLHLGIDFQSRGPNGAPANLEFTAGVEGRVVALKDNGFNTIVVKLSNGSDYQVEYLHSSGWLVSVGDTVHPNTYIGITGNTGPAGTPIHLHVQANDGNGHTIDPRWVMLDPQDLRSMIYRTANERARRDLPAIQPPKLTWRPTAPVRDLDLRYSPGATPARIVPAPQP